MTPVRNTNEKLMLRKVRFAVRWPPRQGDALALVPG
jgi:hypothetical protein